ncbi:phage tail terminator family protein [Paenibacillus glycinis]|uniref:Uncharacterized protein n=1 Tax=Paenibacillus glycinis TaxID=2697035 RepID=A0ABW9XNV7_9BACL|nr:hypothetical protein [Paenibacillus glycinis]NBD24325.1 hypothetical protein [Paenibacillus glycinis]
MNALTGNAIQGSLAAMLGRLYPDVEVYRDAIPAEPPLPCFVVKLVDFIQSRELSNRFRRVHAFEIRYLAASGDAEAMQAIAESLHEHAELLPVEDAYCRGTKMRQETADGELRFYVEYAFRVMQEELSQPLMQAMRQEERINP